MLLELYITLQVITIVILGAAFYSRNVVLWGLGMVFAASLAVAAYGVETQDFVMNTTTAVSDASTNTTTTTYTYAAQVAPKNESWMFGINIALFGLALVMFFFDIYSDVDQMRETQQKRW